MPVVRYEPGQVAQRDLAGSNPTATAASFGAGTAEALAKAGTALTTLGSETIINIDKGSSKDAYNQASNELNQKVNEIFAANQGVALQNIPQLYQQAKQEVMSKYSTGLSPLASSLFEGAFSDYAYATQKQVDDQRAAAAKGYNLEQGKAVIANLSASTAALTDPTEIDKNWKAVQAQVGALNPNASPEIQEAALRKAGDDFWGARVLSRGSISATAAMSELQTVRDKVTADTYNQLTGRFAPAAHKEGVEAQVGTILQTAPNDSQALADASKFDAEVQKGVIDGLEIRKNNRDKVQGAGVAAVLTSLATDPDAPITPGVLNGDETYAVAQLKINGQTNVVSKAGTVNDLKQIAVADGDGWRQIPSLIYKNGSDISRADGNSLMTLYSKRLQGADINTDKKSVLTDGQIAQMVKRNNVSDNDYDTAFLPVYNTAIEDFAKQQGRLPTQEEKFKMAKTLTLQVKSGTFFGFPTTESLYKEYNNGKIPQVSYDQISDPDKKAIRITLWNSYTDEVRKEFKSPDGIPDSEVSGLYSVGVAKNPAF